MSWDILIFNAKDIPSSKIEEIPRDWKPKELGKLEEIRKKITEVLPSINWINPFLGFFEEKEYCIELSFQNSENVETLMLRITGKGNPLPTIVNLCVMYDWVIFDCSSADFVDLNSSWEKHFGFVNTNL